MDKKVLILDNDERIRNIIQSIIQNNFKYEVFSSSDAQDSLAQHRNSPFDLIIVDWNFSNMNMADFLDEIENEGEKPFICVSCGRADVSFHDVVIDRFLFKPFTAEEIKSVVSQI